MIISELELQKDREHPLGLINWLMYFISQKYKDCHNILLIDEIMNYNAEKEGTKIADWSGLDTFRTNVDFLIALNPQGIKFKDNFVVVPPKNTNATLSQQLLTRHRNGYEIGIFLEHLKHNLPLKHSTNHSYLDSSNDSELDPSKLPNSRLPIWIQRGVDVSNEEVLELIKSDYKFPHESITLLYDIDNPLLDENTKEWCRINHWKYCTLLEMIGCEDQIIIILDCMPMFELISRARNQLVIVTTQKFVYIT